MLGELGQTDPARVGPYELVGVLGSGGMGRVYLGRTEAGDQAAVKVIHADLARDPEFRRRFGREAASTRDLAAPGIALVVAADPDAERPWLATEYIAGPSLHEVVTERGVLTPAELRALGAGLAEALAAVHAAGLVHRDVKPPNVLMAETGPKLIDFGIARDIAASTITRTGIALGTPQFMAPEQLQAERTIGAPADVFALAGLLVFAATGRSPFGEGTPAQLLYAVVHSEPRLEGVPETLRPLLARCLAKEQADRPSAAEVAEELRGEAPVEAASQEAASRAEAVPAGSTPQPESAPAKPAPRAEAASVASAPQTQAPTTVLGSRRRRLLAVSAGVVAVLAVAAILVDGHASGAADHNGSGREGAAPPAAVLPGGLTTGPTGSTGGPTGSPTPTGTTAASSGAVTTPGPTTSGGATSSGGHPTSGVPGPTTTPASQGTSHASGGPTSRPTTAKSTSASGCTSTSVPCRTGQQDTTPRIVHSNDPNGLCLVVGIDFNFQPAAAPSQTCSGAVAEWHLLKGTSPGSFQLESVQSAGQCMTSVGPNQAPDLAACDPNASIQWFVADIGGGWSQLKTYASPAACLDVGWLSNAPYAQWSACGGNTWRFG